MEKYIIILFILFSLIPTNAEVITHESNSKIYRTIKFKNGDPAANKILYNFIINTEPKEIIELSKIKPENVIAYRVNLNNYGEDEIIGYVNTTSVFWSEEGFSLFILQMHNGHYRNLSYANFIPEKDIIITNNIKNGYRKLILFSFDIPPNMVKKGDNSAAYYYFKRGKYTPEIINK